MPVPALQVRTTPTAKVEPHFGGGSLPSGGYRLSIPGGNGHQYRLAQLDDYSSLRRQHFPHHPSLTINLRARASEENLPGTWGFGLWNDPFGFSLGFGGNAARMPALPNAVWFFHASPQNFLSFRDDKPGNGFLAQSFHSPSFHPSIIPAALALPFSRRTTRRLFSRLISEDSLRLDMDVTSWHSYKLVWNQGRVIWCVDDLLVLETPIVPRPPLGLVIWIDNQFAAFKPDGKISWGVQKNPPAWLEIDQVDIK